MLSKYVGAFVLVLLAEFAASPGLSAESDPLADLKKEVESLRRRISQRDSESKSLSRAIESRTGGAALPQEGLGAKTQSGRLHIGGLAQIWAYSIRNDRKSIYDIDKVLPGGSGVGKSIADNDSVRVRRAELRLKLDITENIAAVTSLDFAREATGFPPFPQNQGLGCADVVYYVPCGCGLEAVGAQDPQGLITGQGRANRLLKDAYIHYHGFVPHHDFKIGQFKRQLGEEGSRDDGALDFTERAIIAELADFRDLGVQAHGAWVDDRVEYWLGVFDGAGTAFQQHANRSDDNNAKDLAATLRVLPLRDHGAWGTLEAGYSIMNGLGGEPTSATPGSNPTNSLNQRRTTHALQYAWLGYFPGGPVKGWWLRGEGSQYRDRFAPSQASSGVDVVTTDPAPLNTHGWDISTGYRLSQSTWCDRLPKWARGLEFTFRYETVGNIFFHSFDLPERRLNVYRTQVYTAGANYHVSANAKLQLNYNWVLEQDDRNRDERQLREVRNDTLVLNLQVSF